MPSRTPSALVKALQTLQKQGFAKKSSALTPLPSPQLATLREEVPEGEEWIYEPKYDGYRILGVQTPERTALISRNGKDWTRRFPNVAEALRNLKKMNLVLDGEIVTFDQKGKASFSALQKNLSDESAEGYVYFVFDLLFAHGYDIRATPLIARKKLLEHLFQTHSALRAETTIRLTPFSKLDGPKQLAKACRDRSEGIIAKKITEPYRHRRSPDWVKIKCSNEGEFVIAGYTDPQGSREAFGSLLLGYFDSKKRFCYAGKVGTGFNQALLRELKSQFAKFELDRSPFATRLTSLEKRGAHFLKPHFVAQIVYSEWTADKRLRHPVFLGLREDKRASEVKYS